MVRPLIVVAVLATSAQLASAQPAPAPADQPKAYTAGEAVTPPPAAPAPDATMPAPPPAPPPTDLLHPPPPPPKKLMDDRWSVGVQLGWQSFTVNYGSNQKVGFAMFGLAGRFRIVPAIEVGLEIIGGGSSGNLTNGGFYLEGRYRFRAEQPWNFYGSLAIGSIAAAHKDASKIEKQGRGSAYLGFGAERRLGHFAVNAELHLVAVGENTQVTAPMPVTTAYLLERYKLTGVGVLVGGLYYF